MEVRTLHMDQIEAIKQLMLDIFSGEPWNDHWTDEQLHAYVAQLTGNPNSLAFGAFQNGELVGMALGRIINWHEGTEYWIDEFGIHPQSQQAGLGSQFMAEIQHLLIARGIAYIVLLTERHVPAYHFYKKNGFIESKENVFFAKKLEKGSDQLQQVVSIAENLFSEHLLGIYLYGSATLGCLRPDNDLDILIITDQEMSMTVRENLTKTLLSVSGSVGCVEKRPLEITVMNQNDLSPWHFPPKCEYMYGEWLRDEIIAGQIPQAGYDPDIAILLWQARKCSKTLKGIDAEKLIPQIPFSEIPKAIQDSIPGLIHNFTGDERNVLLTLARMWYTLETGEISTKDSAAEWVLSKLPGDLAPLLQIAKDAYLGNVSDHWDSTKDEAIMLGAFMKKEIEKLLEYKNSENIRGKG